MKNKGLVASILVLVSLSSFAAEDFAGELLSRFERVPIAHLEPAK